MPFTANIGEQIVDLQTGAKFKVADAPLDLDEKRYGRVLGDLQATPGQIRGGAQGLVEDQPSPSITPQAAANPPRFPGVESVMKQTAIPLATAAVGALPGLASIPAQMAIGAGGEALNQATSDQPFNLPGIAAAGLLPPAVRGLGAAIKPIARGAAKVFGGENLVKGGIQKIESVLGKKSADVASAETLVAAKAVTAPVQQTQTGKVISQILSKRGRVAGIDQEALDVAEEVVRNAHNAAQAGNPIRYNEVFEQTQNMSALASKAKGKAKGAFIDMREAMLDDLAKIGPEAGDAVKSYRYKKGIEDITEALGKPSPARKIGELLSDPLLKGAFTKQQERIVEIVANQIGNAGLLKIGSSLAGIGMVSFAHPGVGAAAVAIPAIIGALVSAPKIGAVMAKSLVGPSGKVNSMALPALAQMVRGYMAEQAGKEGAQ